MQAARILIASSFLAFGVPAAFAQNGAGAGLERGQSGGTLGLISGGGAVSSSLEPAAPVKASTPPESQRAYKPRTEKVAADNSDDDRPVRKKAKKKKKKDREVAEKERRKRTGFKSFARRYGYSRY